MIRISLFVALMFAFSCKSQTSNQARPAVEHAGQQPKQNASFIAANVPDSLLPKFGKYGCTSTKYKGGFYEYTERGTFEITKDGHYTYHGFDKPSEGTYTVDEKGNLLFSSGYFDGGRRKKLTDLINSFLYFLRYPATGGRADTLINKCDG